MTQRETFWQHLCAFVDNLICYTLGNWVMRRRGACFFYWLAPEEFEAYFSTWHTLALHAPTQTTDD